MKTRLTGLFFLLAYGVSALAAEEKPEQVAKRQADEVAQATIKGDFKKLAELTYPKVIEMIGGRERMIEKMEEWQKDMKAKGYAFRSAKVEDALPLVAGGLEVFTVVPFTLEMKAPTGKATMKSFLLGISADKGKTWTFVDGSGISNREMAKKLLPNLPATLQLPKKEKPVFTKD
jgi:hypothetical protein